MQNYGTGYAVHHNFSKKSMSNITAPFNPFTGKEYEGYNTIALTTAKNARQYNSNEWATFLDWKKHGYKLVNARGAGVHCRYVCSGTKVKSKDAKTGKVKTSTEGFYMNYFVLFNADHAEKVQPKLCPRCHQPIGEDPALSRRDNKTYICSQCGTAEALEDWKNRTK